MSRAVAATGISWEIGHAIPPGLLWNLTLARTQAMVLNALLHPFPALDGQRSFPEVPFADDRPPGRSRRLPWDPAAVVQVPGTGLSIGGRIDRLDLSADGVRARVVDYKTGRHRGDFQLRGGRELQRCLYAYAVRALLAGAEEVEAALLYPSRAQGSFADNIYAPLDSPGETLAQLSAALELARRNMLAGLAVPGVAAGARYADTRNLRDNRQGEEDRSAFALPVVPGTMLEPKKAAARALLGDIPRFWETV